MDVFRFAKVPPRANHPTPRYRLLHGPANALVGDVEIAGGPPTDAVDGKAAAVVGADGCISVFDTASGKQLMHFPGKR
jgi:hypothetical protein